MDRNFMFKNKKNLRVYCGKCGKLMMQDHYNFHKHAAICGPQDDWDDYTPVCEGSCYGYRLAAFEDYLELTICTPVLVPLPGFHDKYIGGKWDVILCAKYKTNSKVINLCKNVSSLSLNDWLSIIKLKKCVKIHKESDADIIRSVFPIVTDVYSLEMFSYIYQNKGLHFRQILPTHLEQKLFTRLPDYSGITFSKGPNAILPMLATLHKYKEEFILRLILMKNQKDIYVFLFSKEYYAVNKPIDMTWLTGIKYYLTADSLPAVNRFSKKFPEMMIYPYKSKSDMLLHLLLSGTYHCGMELVAKSGLTFITENLHTTEYMTISPESQRNVKSLFGIPLGLLRKLEPHLEDLSYLTRLKKIYHYKSALFQFDEFSTAQIQFLCRADLLHDQSGDPTFIPRINLLSDHQLLTVMHYLSKLSLFQMQYYWDYLEAWLQIKNNGFSLTPKNLIAAHNQIILLIQEEGNFNLQRQFMKRVNEDSYQRLTTSSPDNENEFEKDPYCIIAPTVTADLYRESNSMHNCVKIYTERVAYGNTMIYFLRRKKSPEKSLGTIEVSTNGLLLQAKGFANQDLNQEQQLFITKWCKLKGILISTPDIYIHLSNK